MIIKDYITVDNVLSDPEKIRSLATKLDFYTKTDETLEGLNNIKQRVHKPEGNWLGLRSGDLYDYSPEIFHSIFDDVFRKVLLGLDVKYEYTVSSYLHFSPQNCVYTSKHVHIDPHCSFAGVIYLNEFPQDNSGTILYPKNEEMNEVKVENKYNRMIMYKSNVRHRPMAGFGTTAKDSRLTLLFFITRFYLDISNNQL